MKNLSSNKPTWMKASFLTIQKHPDNTSTFVVTSGDEWDFKTALNRVPVKIVSIAIARKNSFTNVGKYLQESCFVKSEFRILGPRIPMGGCMSIKWTIVWRHPSNRVMSELIRQIYFPWLFCIPMLFAFANPRFMPLQIRRTPGKFSCNISTDPSDDPLSTTIISCRKPDASFSMDLRHSIRYCLAFQLTTMKERSTTNKDFLAFIGSVFCCDCHRTIIKDMGGGNASGGNHRERPIPHNDDLVPIGRTHE